MVQASVVKQHGDQSEKHYILLTVTNVGRRPMFVEQVGGKWHQPVAGSPKFYWTTLNKQLKEADLWRSELLEITPGEHENVADFEVHTAGGEVFGLGRRHRKKFLKEIQTSLDEIRSMSKATKNTPAH